MSDKIFNKNSVKFSFGYVDNMQQIEIKTLKIAEKWKYKQSISM